MYATKLRTIYSIQDLPPTGREVLLKQGTLEECTEAIELERMYSFVDSIRESGVINMFDAVYISTELRKEFGITGTDARKVYVDWMATFSSRHKK